VPSPLSTFIVIEHSNARIVRNRGQDVAIGEDAQIQDIHKHLEVRHHDQSKPSPFGAEKPVLPSSADTFTNSCSLQDPMRASIEQHEFYQTDRPAR
jgi:hypothetical protein